MKIICYFNKAKCNKTFLYKKTNENIISKKDYLSSTRGAKNHTQKVYEIATQIQRFKLKIPQE